FFTRPISGSDFGCPPMADGPLDLSPLFLGTPRGRGQVLLPRPARR
ncbi:hypothetical protein, partial [Pseudomonas aeruginosa]